MMRRGVGRRFNARPPNNYPAAQSAWDYFASMGHVDKLQLIDGWWVCQDKEAKATMFVRGAREWEHSK